MKKVNLNFYKEQRAKKRKQRQSKQIRQISLITSVLLIIIITITFFSSKPSVEKIGISAPKKHSQENKKVLLATSNGIKLYLPYRREKLTVIGYHESFNPQAQTLNPKGTEIDTKKISKQQLERYKSEHKELIYSVLKRGPRSGPIDSAVDVGGKANTLVYAPVSGKIVKIRKYKLYGTYADYEIHILPKGVKGYHVVVIHIKNLLIKTGDTIVAKITPLARISPLSKFLKQQLSDYSKEKGDHVHFQVDKLVNGKCSPRM